jgi:branched-chain amino acid aminotransferase
MAWVDGEVIPLAEARVPATDRGFLWGDHVFEVIRAEGDVLLDGAAHLLRLATSARLVRMTAPDLAMVRGAIDATLAAAGLPAAALRVVWTRGDAGGLAPPAVATPRLVIMVEPLGPAPAGVRLAVLHGRRGGGLVPAAVKSGNYLGSVLALAAAAERGADDALLVDDDGVVLETATASLFVVEGDAVVTPSGDLLAGVTAARVSALLGEAGLRVAPARVTLSRVEAASELFVTSSRRGPVPVVALDGDARDAGPITARAITSYAGWVATRGGAARLI